MRIRRIFCIFGLILFHASCVEVTIPVFYPCQVMTISDALPVQFWLSDCDTYNETVPKGVHEKCFCAPWQCDDEITVQFQEDTGGDYILQIKDEEDTVLQTLDFTEVTTGMYQLSFSPNTYDVCDENIQLIIVSKTDGTEILSNPTFSTVMDPWTNVAGAGEDWAFSDGPFDDDVRLSFDPGNTTSDPLRSEDFTVQSPGTYRLYIRITTSTDQTLSIKTYLSGVEVEEILNETYPAGTEISTLQEHEVIITGSFDRIECVASQDVSGVTRVLFLTLLSLKPVMSTEIAKSDCLQIATTQDETELIEYANARNFAGLIYQDISPDASFKLRVPCRFFHETFPEEDEAIELTSSVINTSGQIKTQKLLEVKHAPYYFHKKLQLILKHQTLTINDTLYQKEEKYEINPGNKQWPLKSATCLLTEKNSVLRNVI